MKYNIFTYLLIITILFLPSALAIKNPAAVYCHELGYEYEIEDTEKGDVGYCRIDEDTSFNAWDFFTGKIGSEYSYCAKLGYETTTLDDGQNPYSPEYAACIISSPEVEVQEEPEVEEELIKTTATAYRVSSETISVTDLMDLKDKVKEPNYEEISKMVPKSMTASIPLTEEQHKTTASSLPSSFDWRDYMGDNWLSPNKDQGLCGSCWAFSAVGATEANYRIETNNPNLDIDLSEQYLVSDCCENCGDCDGGWPYRALNYMKDYGISDEDCFDYSWTGLFGKSCSSRCSDWSSRLNGIYDWNYVAENREAIKRALVEDGPLSIGLYWGGLWDTLGGLYHCNEEDPSTYHAVVLVGYNDEEEYWIIQNSWGWLGDLFNGVKIGYGECGLEEYFLIQIRATEPECEYDYECNYLDDDSCVGSWTYHTEGYCSNYECDSYSYFGENCDDYLVCNGQETCSNGFCLAGEEVDCSEFDTIEIDTCTNSPDDNPFTYDYRPFTASECLEPNGCSVVIGSGFIEHTCDIDQCGAECEDNSDCPDTDCDYLDECVGRDYYDYHDISNDCVGCECESKECTDYTITINDTECWDFKVNSPKDEVYDSRYIDLDVESREEMDEILYSVNGGSFRTLCRGCKEYNGRKSFYEGENHLVVKFLSEGNHDVELDFTIDSQSPRISRTNPTRGYSNGEFSVEYSEDNPIMTTLHCRKIGEEAYKEHNKTDCPKGREKCNFDIDVFEYDGYEIEYYFSMEDIAGNIVQSRQYSIEVDETDPEITIRTPFEEVYDERKVLFDLNVSEEGELSYIDHEDNNAREKRLCSNCDEYGREVSFRNGFHNLTIYARDEAGNSDNYNFTFTTDYTPPKISSIEPRRGYATGDFIVKYTEESCEELIIGVQSPTHGAGGGGPCTSGRNVIEEIYLNLSSFEGETIEVEVTIIDIAGSSASRIVDDLVVDTTPPNVLKDDWERDGRYLNLDLQIDEKASFYYIDYEYSPRERRLCSRCDEYDRSKYFSRGFHNVTIFAVDEAGNQANILNNIEFQVE